MPDRPRFVFVTCQIGAETAVKAELARRWAEFRFAFSRPGFLTFKLPDDHRLYADFDLESVFARTYGFSLGAVRAADPAQLARDVWQGYGRRPVRRIHVWQREGSTPGNGGDEVSITPAAVEARQILYRHCPCTEALAPDAADWQAPARRGEFVLDCILVGPNEWWVGYHRVASSPSQWPGGIVPLELPAHAVSRSWLKMEEALRWSLLPIHPGAQCAELGAAPGGSSQALLDRGAIVTGIDPAEMHPALLQHPRFTHLRSRADQVRRRQFRKIRWLMADMNVAPEYTLEVVGDIATHATVRIRGMLLTLKLPQWKLAEKVSDYLRHVRDWGFNIVRARQLANNRREICVAALKKPFRR